jgi:hypothetical protein
MTVRLALASLLAVSCAAGAIASSRIKETAPAKLKTPTAVNVDNKRHKSLLTFEIMMATTNGQDKIVGRLERPLAAGKSMSVRLKGALGCNFRARWKFDDVDDSGTVDLCSDAHIVLID